GNLSFNATTADLEALFGQAGTVSSATIISDKFSGQSRGFGFVEMDNQQEAQAAIERFNGYDLQGRALKVNEARPRPERTGGGRRGRVVGWGRGRWGSLRGRGPRWRDLEQAESRFRPPLVIKSHFGGVSLSLPLAIMEASMGDKSPKAKQRDQKQKEAAKAG